MPDDLYLYKKVICDGVEAYRFLCPRCGMWGMIDDDQFHGRVSMVHDTAEAKECSFHETVDLSRHGTLWDATKGGSDEG